MRMLFLLLAALVCCLAANVASAREILFAGDVTLTRNISPNQKEFFSPGAREFIEHADLFIWNLEFSGASKNVKDKTFVFSCDSDIVERMEFSNGVALIANNHSFDGNVEGFKNLVGSLDKFKLRYSGLRNPDATKNYVEIEHPDCRFFVISYSPMSHSSDPAYTTTTWEDVLATVEYLNTIRNDGDVIVVNIHDGVEKTTQIAKRQETQANELAERNVDIVSFTHSHTYIDPTKIGNTIVLWGLGNFIFGGNNNWRNNKDVRLMLVDPDTKEWRWIKGHTKNYVFDLKENAS